MNTIKISSFYDGRPFKRNMAIWLLIGFSVVAISYLSLNEFVAALIAFIAIGLYATIFIHPDSETSSKAYILAISKFTSWAAEQDHSLLVLMRDEPEKYNHSYFETKIISKELQVRYQNCMDNHLSSTV